jgi:hypothetical protein
MRDDIRAQVLAAVEAGRLPRGGPSHVAALDLVDDMSAAYWAEWSEHAAERIKAKAEHPRCCCGTFSEPGRDGRCERCCGWPT